MVTKFLTPERLQTDVQQRHEVQQGRHGVPQGGAAAAARRPQAAHAAEAAPAREPAHLHVRDTHQGARLRHREDGCGKYAHQAPAADLANKRCIHCSAGVLVNLLLCNMFMFMLN